MTTFEFLKKNFTHPDSRFFADLTMKTFVILACAVLIRSQGQTQRHADTSAKAKT